MSYHRRLNAMFRRRNIRASRAGRMSCLGRNVLDENLNPFVFRGFNEGHGEMTSPGDPADDFSMGANAVRIIWRGWGPYQRNGGTTLDGQSLGSPWGIDPTYFAGIITRVKQAKAAGLKVILAGDSNCGQNGTQGMPSDTSTYTFCTMFSVPGSNFFTPEGATQRVWFYAAWRAFARALYGYVDAYEPLVEPGPTGSSQAVVSILQDEVRSIIMQEDPYALFIIGGYPDYQVPHINDCYLPKWGVDSNTILTADMLDNAVSDPVNFPNKVATVVSARATFNVPVMINQLGSTIANDPGDTNLISACQQLRDASGGSIGWTFWEKVSAGLTSYGPYKDNGTGRVLASASRLANMAILFSDVKHAAT